MPLLNRKPKDALGQPFEPNILYTPIIPFAGTAANGSQMVWNDRARLRGDHPDVLKYADRFVSADTDSETLARLRAQRLYGRREPTPEKPRPAAIPPERQAVASETFWSGAEFIAKGRVLDDRAALVQRHPEFFHRPPQPIKPPEAA